MGPYGAIWDLMGPYRDTGETDRTLGDYMGSLGDHVGTLGDYMGTLEGHVGTGGPCGDPGEPSGTL